jgi:acetoacetyl-CoA reductase
MSRQVIEGMRDRTFGRIVNIASINGQKGQFGQVNYSACQGWHAWIYEGAGTGMCQERHYGKRDMSWVCSDRDGTSYATGCTQHGGLAADTVGRLGTPHEIARCVLFLVSEDAGFTPERP